MEAKSRCRQTLTADGTSSPAELRCSAPNVDVDDALAMPGLLALSQEA